MITSHSSLPLVPTAVSNTPVNAELKRTNSSFTNYIQNVGTGPVLLKHLPVVAMDRIACFLSFKDIKNMQKSDVYPKIGLVRQHKVNAIQDKYSKTINALHEWKVSPCRGKEENRNLAVKRIMDCIFSDNESLDLSNLNLKSLPDISFLDFLIELDYQGNDGSFIESCFDLKMPHGQKLKNQSPLPSSVRSITINFGPLMLAGTERSGLMTFEKPELPLPKEWEFIKDYYSSYQFFYIS